MATEEPEDRLDLEDDADEIDYEAAFADSPRRVGALIKNGVAVREPNPKDSTTSPDKKPGDGAEPKARRKSGSKKRNWFAWKASASRRFTLNAMKHVSHLDACVWAVLLELSNEGVAKASQALVAAIAGSSQVSVSRSIKRLVALGLLQVVRAGGQVVPEADFPRKPVEGEEPKIPRSVGVYKIGCHIRIDPKITLGNEEGPAS